MPTTTNKSDFVPDSDENEFANYYGELDHLTEINPLKMCEAVARTGYLWADADASATALEETKKSLLAELTLKYIESSKVANGKGISKIEAEIRALEDPEYDIHIRLMVDARRKANKLRVKFDTGKMFIDLTRSVHATKRAEMTMR